MATPIGHSLLGIGLGKLTGNPIGTRNWKWYVFSSFAACAADFDFIPGLLMGDMNRFHQGVSHSFLAAVIFGFLFGFLFQRGQGLSFFKVSISATVIYSSHLILDFFCSDKRAPFGQPLLWPISEEHYISPWAILGGVRHGVPGEDFITVLRQIYSMENFKVVSLEFLFIAPVLFILLFLSKFKPYFSKREPFFE